MNLVFPWFALRHKLGIKEDTKRRRKLHWKCRKCASLVWLFYRYLSKEVSFLLLLYLFILFLYVCTKFELFGAQPFWFSLWFALDPNLTTKQHVIQTCQTACFELKRISSIRRYLTEDAAKQMVTSCVLSRLNYCNSLLMGTPNSIIQTDAESPKYWCTPHSQSTTLSKLHTSPTATPLPPNF